MSSFYPGLRPDPPPPQPAVRPHLEPRDFDAYLAERAATLENPSRRVPHMSWYTNDADQIEVHLEQDGHDKWGFVIYRTTYDSDEDWAEWLRRLRIHMEKNFDLNNGRDILEKFELTVLDDRAAFDGATADDVRRHFQKWSLDAFATEQPFWQDEEIVRLGNSARYKYAIQVDKDSLNACVHEANDPSQPGRRKSGWVRLIDKSWYLGRGVGDSEWEDEAIEGLMAYDVGWMKVSFMKVMPQIYASLWNGNTWQVVYQRPPEEAR